MQKQHKGYSSTITDALAHTNAGYKSLSAARIHICTSQELRFVPWYIIYKNPSHMSSWQCVCVCVCVCRSVNMKLILSMFVAAILLSDVEGNVVPLFPPVSESPKSFNWFNSTFLYVLNYVALLKHILTSLCTTALTTFSAWNAFSSWSMWLNQWRSNIHGDESCWLGLSTPPLQGARWCFLKRPPTAL